MGVSQVDPLSGNHYFVTVFCLLSSCLTIPTFLCMIYDSQNISQTDHCHNTPFHKQHLVLKYSALKTKLYYEMIFY